MKIKEYILRLKELGACEEAVKAARGYATSQELWDDCLRLLRRRHLLHRHSNNACEIC